VREIIREAVRQTVLSAEGIAVYVTYCDEASISTCKTCAGTEDLVIVQCTCSETAMFVDQIFGQVTNIIVLVCMNDRDNHPECLNEAYRGVGMKIAVIGLPLNGEDIAFLNIMLQAHLESFNEQISLVT